MMMKTGNDAAFFLKVGEMGGSSPDTLAKSLEKLLSIIKWKVQKGMRKALELNENKVRFRKWSIEKASLLLTQNEKRRGDDKQRRGDGSWSLKVFVSSIAGRRCLVSSQRRGDSELYVSVYWGVWYTKIGKERENHASFKRVREKS